MVVVRGGVSLLLAGALASAGLAVCPATASAEPGKPDVGAECADVIVLAVPGTWETNGQADRNVVPGMLANVTGPLVQELNGGMGGAGITLPQRSTSTSSTSTALAPTSTRSTPPSGKPSTTPAAAPKATIRAEQVPYIAQVGGPIAGMVTGNPLTLKQSRENGTSALDARAKELAGKCPLSKFVVLGYSQGALVAGDFLSNVGNRKGPIDPSRILAGALLSDPKRSASTSDPESDTPSAKATKLSSVSETMVGPNVSGQGVLGERDGGMGVLAERVTTMCAPNDSICSLSGKSKVVAAIVPLLNLTPEDLPDYLMNKGLQLVKNIASAPPEDLMKAATSVITEITKVTVAASTAPESLPLVLAQMVFASTALDDVAKVVNMPEFDAFVSLTHPAELIQQGTQALSYLLLDAHRSYASYKVDGSGDSATQWIVKWIVSKVQAGL